MTSVFVRIEVVDCFIQKPSSIVTSVFFITNRPLYAQIILDEYIALFSRIEIAIALHKEISGLDTSLIQSSGKLPSASRSACGVGSISTGIDGVISTVRRSDTSMWARLRVFLIRTMRRSLSFS